MPRKRLAVKLKRCAVQLRLDRPLRDRTGRLEGLRLGPEFCALNAGASHGGERHDEDEAIQHRARPSVP